MTEVATVIMHAELQYIGNAILQLPYTPNNLQTLEKLTIEAINIIQSLNTDADIERSIKIINDELNNLENIKNKPVLHDEQLLVAGFLTLKVSLHNLIYKIVL
jgi:hypothetical protein